MVNENEYKFERELIEALEEQIKKIKIKVIEDTLRRCQNETRI